MSYSYLGGGSQYDPPNTYGIVSKNMPLPMADMLAAVVLFLTGGNVDEEFFVRIIYAQISRTITKDERAGQIRERKEHVRQRLEVLRHTYSSGMHLLGACGVVPIAEIAPNVAAFLNTLPAAPR